jgi:Glycosyl hydrolase family 92
MSRPRRFGFKVLLVSVNGSAPDSRSIFFLYSEAFVKYPQQVTATATTLNPAYRTGDFSSLIAPGVAAPHYIRDPQSGLPCNATSGVGGGCFPGNIIPQNRLSPNGVGLMSIFPTPTPGFQLGTSNLLQVGSYPGSQEIDSGSLDIIPTDKDTIRFRLIHFFYHEDNPFNSAFGIAPRLYDRHNQTGSLDWVHTLTPNTTNEVSLIAARLGKTAESAYFQDRAHNYANIFNKATGFMQARNFDGSWASADAGWTEGNPWVYTFAVMQDLPGLIQLMGGNDKYNALLDQHFAGKHNIHKNEPSHHYGYLYDYSGQPWKTQAKVREIVNAEYSALPAGLDGDDDCGQMSAWYLFTALGFYPVTPASGDYMIGSPLFASMRLNRPNGHRFTVTARNNSATNVYIQSATLNGRPLDKPVLTWEQIESGGALALVMGPQSTLWAADWHPTPLPGKPTGNPPVR